MKNTPVLNKKCPICGKQTILEYQPFCSKKCADIDLGRWLKGDYVMHTNEVPTDEEWTSNAIESAKNE